MDTEKEQAEKNLNSLYEAKEKSLGLDPDSSSYMSEVQSLFNQARANVEKEGEINLNSDKEKIIKEMAVIMDYKKHMDDAKSSRSLLSQRMESMLMELQAHDIICQITEHLSATFVILSEMLTQMVKGKKLTYEYDFCPLVEKMFGELSTQNERKIFKDVFFERAKFEGEMPPMLPKKFTLLTTYVEFIDLYIRFHNGMFLYVNTLAETMVDRICSQLEDLLRDASRLSSFSKESLGNINKIRDIISKSDSKQLFELDQLNEMTKNIGKVATHNKDFRNWALPLVASLQFQDRIYQAISNLGKIFQFFQETLFFKDHQQILSVFDPKEKNFKSFGEEILKYTTLPEERKIIHKIFDISAADEEEIQDQEWDDEGNNDEGNLEQEDKAS